MQGPGCHWQGAVTGQDRAHDVTPGPWRGNRTEFVRSRSSAGLAMAGKLHSALDMACTSRSIAAYLDGRASPQRARRWICGANPPYEVPPPSGRSYNDGDGGSGPSSRPSLSSIGCASALPKSCLVAHENTVILTASHQA